MTRNRITTRRSGRLVPAAFTCLAAAFAAVAPAVTHAAYPEQRINMIVSCNPGGGTDLIARVIVPYRGIAAPKELPAPIREQLAAVELAARDPQFQAQAASDFAPLRYLPPAEYEAELREAEEGFRKMWQENPWVEK